MLANEFDSLKQQNERLETNVKSLEHERDKLRSSLKETKGSLHKLEKEMAEKDNGKEADKDKIWVNTITVSKRENQSSVFLTTRLPTNQPALTASETCYSIENLEIEARCTFSILS